MDADMGRLHNQQQFFFKFWIGIYPNYIVYSYRMFVIFNRYKVIGTFIADITTLEPNGGIPSIHFNGREGVTGIHTYYYY